MSENLVMKGQSFNGGMLNSNKDYDDELNCNQWVRAGRKGGNFSETSCSVPCSLHL